MAPQQINWAIYDSLPPKEAQYQLAHIHDSRKASVAAAYAVCLPIAFIAVIMRFVSRRIGRVSYGLDDWVIVMAYVRHSYSLDICVMLTNIDIRNWLCHFRSFG